jgi:ribosome recycling factor
VEVTVLSLDEAKRRMGEVLTTLDGELTKVRTGRANPAIVEGLLVASYGALVPVKQVASITVPEPTQILIAPWDRGLLGAIEQAVRESDLGLNPVNDGTGVRLSLPPLSTERRHQLVKLVGQLAEEAKVALRQVRHEALESVKNDTTATEDDRFVAEKLLNAQIAEQNSAVDARVKAKETALTTI